MGGGSDGLDPSVLRAELRAHREMTAERFRSLSEALRLQAVEYERRLAELNNAHERAETVARATVSIGKFEDFVSSQEAARRAAERRVEDQLSALENWRSRATGAAVILGAGSGLIGAAIMSALGG